jgi:hypothetical protein
MGHAKTFNDDAKLPEAAAKRAQTIAMVCAVVGLGASFAGGLLGLFGGDAKELHHQFYFSWLTAFFFFTTISLGGLFFTVLHHLVRASWSTGLRRIAENLAMNIPLMAVCALVLAMGFGDVYHWAHIDPAQDPIFAVKEPYLNVGFFTVRAVVFFALWTGLAFFFRKNSVAQDGAASEEAASAFNFKMRRLAPLSMLAFALTLTFFAFDWLMSLDPHWFSTMFGVYIFAGTVVSLFATLIIATLWLTRNNAVSDTTLTIGVFHDAGKLMFGFTVFWTYITFSQYYLIWYANIPEETGWFMHRSHGGWDKVAMLIAVGHFILPFWTIMSRHVKRNRFMLGLVAGWMLFMHFVDLYFVIMPTHHAHLHLHWLDVTTFVGVGGAFLMGFLYWCKRDSLVARKDPQLTASMGYDNV